MNNLKRKFIVVEGNIGAGKTTVSTRIAKDFNGRLILEQFEDNPFLPKFYADKERYAFQVELSFLASRYKQFNEELSQRDLFSDLTVADYYFMKSYIFAKNTLNDDEFQLYRQIFNMAGANVVKPDVLIYIHRDVDILLKNIKKRGRAYECGMSHQYLKELQKGYFSYFKEINQFPIVIIDAGNEDLLLNNNYEKLLKIIEETRQKGVSYIKFY